MAKALALAGRGRGSTSPNPMVGAVIVSGNRIVGQGYHRRAGGSHAEVIALASAGRRARDAALYVTLEPCCHTNKRTPPCVPAIIASGLRRVVVAMRDPNLQVNGKGIQRLRGAGLDVAVGCLRDRAERLNEAYIHWIKTGRPFVLLKAAMTLDGKIATASGESQWISGEAARREVHRLRRQIDAVMVGIGTVLRDDPSLTARLSRGARQQTTGRQPLRVIVDSRLRIPLTAKALTASPSSPTVIVTTKQASKRRIEQLKMRGATVLIVSMRDGRVSLADCLIRLGKMGVTTVLLEGGSELNAAALRAGLVNRIRLYVAPMLLGGQDAKGMIGGPSPKKLAGGLRLNDLRIGRAGDDIVLEAVPSL
ncbi:MAG: bifunctional diaminohydroxyphosphoribosylaminopyrimidine deaminase/5-amino-6-(5-phosphoribosylamino)uracil reductase RibD [Nitrospiraceae bacterium]